MKAVDIQDLPSLTYQFLILASKGFGRRDVVRGVLGFFDGRRTISGSPAVVRQVEGTVLMHVSFAVKQDPSLAQEVMAVVKSDAGILNHFTVLVVMAVARVRRFGESAMGILRSVVLTAYKDYRFSRQCKWIPEELKEECTRKVKLIEESLMRAVSESSNGREHVVPSIVQFGFVLLESADTENCKGLEDTDKLLGIEELGIRMLRTLFEIHDMARNEIVEQCKFRILALKPQQSLSIIKLLSDLARHFPYPMLDHVARLKELLDYFTFMSDRIALATALGILPLTKFSRELQDYIILVARKALFRREETIRLAAINVILELILEESRSRKKELNSLKESSSQASSSQHTDIPSKGGLRLFHELNGLLYRSFSQEARIKEAVYHGLLKLIVIDPSVSGAVLEFLWPHFLRFYKQDLTFPLKIHDCVKLVNDRVYLEEPLDSLLSCVSRILFLQPQIIAKGDQPSEFSRAFLGFSLSQEIEVAKPSFQELFCNALSGIRKALRSASLEDMIGHREEPSSCSLLGDQRSYCSWLLCGITEVFIDIAASEMKKSTDLQKQGLELEVLELINVHESLEKDFQSIKRQNARKWFKRVPEVSDCLDNEAKEVHRVPFLKLTEARKPFMSCSSIQQLLVTAITGCEVNNLSSQTVCQSNGQTSCHMTLDHYLRLISFSAKSFHHQLKSILFLRDGEPLESWVDEYITSLVLPLFQSIWLFKLRYNSERGQKKKENKGKKSGSGLEEICISLSFLYELIKVCPDNTSFFGLIKNLALLNTDENDMRADDNSCHEQNLEMNEEEVYANIFLTKKLRPLYLEFLELSFFHECEVLSDIMLTIGNRLTRKLRSLYGDWAADLCRNVAVENPKAARRMAGLAIFLCSPPEDLSIAQFMASELLNVTASDNLKISETCPIINDLTALSICSELLLLIETVLADLDWTLTKLKSLTYKDSGHIYPGKNSVFGEGSLVLLLEEALYSRTEALVNLLAYFAEMDLKDSQAELLLKLTAKFYKIMAHMVKLHIAPKGFKQSFPGQKFQKLAEVTCKMLTIPLYNFLALTQQNQLESAQVRGILNKIKRENKCIPDLIFQIEDYEKYLIKLGKLTKVNYMRNAKRSTARDFRIIGPKKNGMHEDMPERSQRPECDPSQGNPEEPANVSPEEGTGPTGRNGNVEEALPERENGASVAEASDSNEEDGGVIIKAKRAKMTKVVQDSDGEN